jgi:hypothetical protein
MLPGASSTASITASSSIRGRPKVTMANPEAARLVVE